MRGGPGDGRENESRMGICTKDFHGEPCRSRNYRVTKRRPYHVAHVMQIYNSISFSSSELLHSFMFYGILYAEDVYKLLLCCSFVELLRKVIESIKE